ncbi:MAG: hypothetical protein A3F11_00270 [Gammaproteobacteria bacterium RIFCSPHIGHO2_12_FULL_37_14]|nr:MAG: hypothetical protein A3F11_00270 [Gammaproteobacteria bacterium RIFCSPHIGHO2_12_FULL_37_14]
MKAVKNETNMSHDARIAVLETTILNINSTLLDIRQDIKRQSDKMDSKFDALENKFDKKFDAVDSKFDALEKKMDSKFDAIQNRLWSNFLWLMGMMIGLTGSIAHTQHWI